MAADRPLLKIYGERNTGTNYLESLLAINLEVRLLPGVVPPSVYRGANIATRIGRRLAGRPGSGESLNDLWFRYSFAKNLGWKHRLASPESLAAHALADRVTFVTLTKNPYSWLLSLFDRPYNPGGQPPSDDFDQFLRTRWWSFRRDGGPRWYDSPIALWNAKNRAYMSLAEARGARTLSYEQLVADPELIIGQIATAAAASTTARFFTNITASTKGGGHREFSDYRDYYLNERWQTRLSPSAVITINATVDHDVMRYFSYEQVG